MYVVSFAFIVNKQVNNFKDILCTNRSCTFLNNETICLCPFTVFLVNLPIKVPMFHKCLRFKPSKRSQLNNRTIYGEWARVLSFFLGLLLCGMGVLLLQPGCIYVRSGLNSHYFHIIGDKLINPIVVVYIPIIRIPY